MLEVSDAFLGALSRSHDVTARVEVWRDGKRILDALPITDGSVTIDTGSKVRRSLDLTTSRTDLDPQTVTDLLSPFGTELRVWSGIRFAQGYTEEVPVGVFGIRSAGRSGWLSALTIKADDRAATISDDALMAPLTVSGSVLDAVTQLAGSAVSGLEVYDATARAVATKTSAAKATYTDNRWDAIEKIMDALSCEAVFDPEGRLVIRDVPTVPGSPVWSVLADDDNATLVDFTTGISADGFYNAVVATSSGDGPVVSAVAYQKSGPLRWRPGLRRPRSYSSPLLRSPEAAQKAAQTILARSLAVAQTLEVSALPNAALDVLDTVTVRRPGGSSEGRLVSKITLPLTPGAMSLALVTGTDAGTSDTVGGL